MSWAKLDDRYDDHRKVKRAWREDPATVGLHAMAITYSSRHETDGMVDPDWLVDKLPNDRRRVRVLEILVARGLFEPQDDGHYLVHDYLDHNYSRDEIRERRRVDAERKARSRAGGRS